MYNTPHLSISQPSIHLSGKSVGFKQPNLVLNCIELIKHRKLTAKYSQQMRDLAKAILKHSENIVKWVF